MIQETFIENMIQLRKKAGLSQRKLGEELGVSNRAVSKWENGLAMPTIDNLYKMSKLFRVPIDAFWAEADADEEREAHKGMKSLTELYKIGRGPSSSHTMGPEKACLKFLEKNPDADRFRAVLYGSLAKTGKGHGTDRVIRKTFYPVFCDVEFDYTNTKLPHPNTMELFAYAGNQEIDRILVLSVGGGEIEIESLPSHPSEKIYDLSTFSEIAKQCRKRRIRLWQYAIETEGPDFEAYMQTVWEAMKHSIHAGLEAEGILPGGLNVVKKAKHLIGQQHIDESAETKENRVVCAYAFAVGEQNASGEKIVTAPTCGAAGVVPAVLYYQQQKRNYSDTDIIHALITAGLIGNLIKTNASISGAECGCQAEIGSACAMAAAALGELFGLDIDKIEYAAEIAIEHHLGLTCDPICGLVQIPCIERNAVAAMRAINAVSLASFLSDTRKISLDKVIQTMKETGLDLRRQYKETAEGGLAKLRI